MATFISFMLVGCVTGVLAGLLGIGGGSVIVPIVIIAVKALGVPDDMVMKIALATSFAVIISSTASSAYSHSKHGSILWKEFPYLAIGTIIGVLSGSYVVNMLSNTFLQVVFCIFLTYTIYNLLFPKQKKDSEDKSPNPPKTWLSGGGVIIGFLSSFIGIAGGSITVPLLTAFGYGLRKCIATSSMLGVILAFFGAISGIYYGWGDTKISEYFLGYVYLPAFVGVGITSVFFAPLGVKLAYKLPVKWIRWIFAGFLILVLLKMLSTVLEGFL